MSGSDYGTLLIHLLRMTSPILLCALAVLLCSKVRILNLFTEGSLFFSAFVGILAYQSWEIPLLAVCAAMMAGVASSGLVGYLIVYQKANPIITSIASNVTIAGLVTYFNETFSLEGALAPFLQETFLTTVPLEFMGKFTYLDSLAYGMVPLLWFFFQKTVLGFRLGALGVNPEAALSMGMEVEKVQFTTIIISGGFCGLAGALVSLGSSGQYLSDMMQGRGYIAFVACQLGGNHPVGVLLSSIFFGIGKTWRDMLEYATLNRYLADIFPYVITLLALMVQGKKKNHLF